MATNKHSSRVPQGRQTGSLKVERQIEHCKVISRVKLARNDRSGQLA